jgi:hypothetical protein
VISGNPRRTGQENTHVNVGKTDNLTRHGIPLDGAVFRSLTSLRSVSIRPATARAGHVAAAAIRCKSTGAVQRDTMTGEIISGKHSRQCRED